MNARMIAMAAVVLFLTLRQPAKAAGPCNAIGAELDGDEMELIRLVNQYRVAEGEQPLIVSRTLNRAAAWMAEDLASHNYFSHTDSLGRMPYERAIDCGYPNGAGENLAAGMQLESPAAVLAAWQASPGHNDNMLRGYAVIGVARSYGGPYGAYWATSYGYQLDAQPAPLFHRRVLPALARGGE